MAATHVASQSVPVRCIGAAGSRRKKPAPVFTTCPLRGSTRQQATKHRQVLNWLSSTTIRFTSGAKRRVPVAGFVKPVTVLDTMREQFTATVLQHPEPHHRINATNQQSPGPPTSNHQKQSHSASLRDANPTPTTPSHRHEPPHRHRHEPSHTPSPSRQLSEPAERRTTGSTSPSRQLREPEARAPKPGQAPGFGRTRTHTTTNRR